VGVLALVADSIPSWNAISALRHAGQHQLPTPPEV
jgi:hypothetical protein